MAQFGEKVWFHEIGEDGVSSFASRMSQGSFVGHHDRTGAVLCITKNGVVRGKSWTRQTLSDAWESTDLSADIEAHGHTGGCPGCAALASHGTATKPHTDECRERIRTIIERTLTGKARMNACKDRIAETEQGIERKRARVERGAGDVPLEPGNRDDEQMAVRHAAASGDDITENQHEENRMRDIHVGKRGSEAASEEQPDKLRKTVRFEQEAPSAASSSDPAVPLEYGASGETQDRPGSVLVQKSGHVDDDVQISALDVFNEMDGRKSRYIRELLDWYRGEDAEDLKRSEVNELVENMACLSALAGKICKSNPKIVTDEKSWKEWKSNQKIAMNEESVPNSVILVQNSMMDEKIVKNIVMNAEVVRKLSWICLFLFKKLINKQFSIQQPKLLEIQDEEAR